MVRCVICAVSTLRMCFYACRISLISGLSNEDLICLDRQLKLSWLFCDWNLFSYFTGGCKQFCTGELIFRYPEFVFAGICFSLVLHMDVAFPCE